MHLHLGVICRNCCIVRLCVTFVIFCVTYDMNPHYSLTPPHPNTPLAITYLKCVVHCACIFHWTHLEPQPILVYDVIQIIPEKERRNTFIRDLFA